jgi:signal transduction histidine kinase
MARSAVDLYAHTSRAHELRLHLPETPVVVRCDAARVEQVANNLVSNAIKYSPDGGRIDVSIERSADRAVLAISDEGVGIAQEELARIFQPFRRGIRLKDAVPGLGLGLATSRRIVERHGGRIEVASSPGCGSTFRVVLPVGGDAARRDGTERPRVA